MKVKLRVVVSVLMRNEIFQIDCLKINLNHKLRGPPFFANPVTKWSII